MAKATIITAFSSLSGRKPTTARMAASSSSPVVGDFNSRSSTRASMAPGKNATSGVRWFQAPRWLPFARSMPASTVLPVMFAANTPFMVT